MTEVISYLIVHIQKLFFKIALGVEALEKKKRKNNKILMLWSALLLRTPGAGGCFCFQYTHCFVMVGDKKKVLFLYHQWNSHVHFISPL